MSDAVRFKDRLSSFWRVIKWSFEARPKLTFTREGQLFSLTTLGLGVAATNSGNNLLYLILGMMLSLILSSGVLSSLNLHRLRVTRRAPRFATAGEPFEVTLTLQNLKRSWPSMGVRVQEPSWERVGGVGLSDMGALREIYCFKIDPLGEEPIHYEALCAQRGHYSISGARIVTGFPFGLFQKSVGLNARATIKVYPRLDRASKELSTLSRSAQLGVALSAESGGGVTLSQAREELTGLRPLEPSEPLKLIHWRASAKRGELIKAQYHSLDYAQVTLWVNPHFSAMQEPPSAWEVDEWANLIASACAMLLKSGGVRVLFPAHDPWVVRSPEQLAGLLEWLVDAQLTPRDERLHPPSDAIVISHPSGRSLLEAQPVRMVLSPLEPELGSADA